MQKFKEFSGSGIVFSDYECAEVLMKKIINELVPESNSFFAPSFIMAIQQLEMNQGGISEVEKKSYSRFLRARIC